MVAQVALTAILEDDIIMAWQVWLHAAPAVDSLFEMDDGENFSGIRLILRKRGNKPLKNDSIILKIDKGP